MIGARRGGLAAGKALADRDIDFDWFRRRVPTSGPVADRQRQRGRGGHHSLHLNSSRPRTQYPSYPMPEDWSDDYPPYYQVAQYFDDFADHFGLREADHVQHRR